ncbi:MAG: YARHG domain-containing protein [Oscillospiraceae bacterium]|nr:YARHG domain-containing protein [Oscillospiraceae bacterium]
MKCPVCKEEIADNSKFCVKCGKQIPRCPTCGKVIETRAKFCVSDGTPLPEEVLALLPMTPAPRMAPVPPVKEQAPKGVETEKMKKPAPARHRFCTQCGKPCEEGQTLCASCRPRSKGAVPVDEEQPPRRSFCIKCGRPCSDSRTICVECRSKMRSAERQSEQPERDGGAGTIILVVAIVLVLLLIIGVALYFVFSGNRDVDDKQEPTSTGTYWSVNDNSKDWDDSGKDDEEEDLIGTVATEVVPTEGEPTEVVTEPVVVTEAIEETTAPTEPPVDVNSVEYRLDYFINHCDSEYFSENYFDGFEEEDCRIARNAIYAKSGRKFNDASLQGYYEQYSWYVPSVDPGNFSASMLNDYQLSNVNAILNYEGSHGYN